MLPVFPYWTKPGWHWWFRFKKPSFTVATSGCFDDECNPDDETDGCKCNEYNRVKKDLKVRGFKLVAMAWWGFVHIGPNGAIMHEYHNWGR